jgi:hypothetical protein
MDIERETEEYVAFVSEHMVPKAMTIAEVIDETNKDTQLQTLKMVVSSEPVDVGKVDKSQMDIVEAMYAGVIPELTITCDGLILRGSRLVLPESLQEKALKIVHEGHQGISKTKSLLRTKVWFKGMDSKVEKLIMECLACQLERKTGAHIQPLIPTPMPDSAWTNLAMDFYGPLPNGKELMVVMDEFSRMPVVMEVKSTAAEFVVPKLDDLFSFVGIPAVLKTDNGPPFNGFKFTKFADYLGFKHRKTTPLHPRGNGLSESFMKNMSKVVRTAKVQGRDWRQVLNEFLRNYRSTPHSTTGVAPSELLSNRNKTSRLPTIASNSLFINGSNLLKVACSLKESLENKFLPINSLNLKLLDV